MKLVCKKCHQEYTENNFKWRCHCGGYLATDHKPIFTKKDIKQDRFNMWRYDAAYPLKYENLFVTFNEGLTPLVKIPSSLCNLRVKMDNLMPTGSFKDRGTVMVVNYLIKQGVNKITEDSSGNAGASVAGYCALGNINCDIYIPKGNSFGKTIQIRSYGATIHEIEGTREDVAAAAQIDINSYAGHNWHPMFLEGTKSIAYELWEQNNFVAPKNIIAVAGNGSSILGIYYGFKDLLRNKQIDEMPRLFAAQATNCNPIYRKFNNIETGSVFTKTIAEGIALAVPNKIDSVVDAIKDTKGEILSVDESEIILALKELSLTGLYVEPTSATAYAGIKQLYNQGIFKGGDDVVMMISGNGLKVSSEIGELYKK